MSRSRMYLITCLAAMMACSRWCLPSRAQSLQFHGGFEFTTVTGVIRAADGNLYGTTYDSTTAGTIFESSRSGEPTLYTFSGGADGGHPDGNMAQGPDGSLYGQTDTGGANNAGTIFRLTLNGTLTTLHAFTPLGSDGTNTDGFQVAPSLLITGDGTIYGVTIQGGLGGTGVFFKITSAGVFTVLHAFSKVGTGGVNTDGANPRVGLVQSADGNLYGVTSTGGAGGTGVVFEVSAANGYQVLHAFAPLQSGANVDGADPEGLFPNADGSLSGITVAGGAEQAGTLFAISASGAFSVTTPLHIDYPHPIAGAPAARRPRRVLYPAGCGKRLLLPAVRLAEWLCADGEDRRLLQPSLDRQRWTGVRRLAHQFSGHAFRNRLSVSRFLLEWPFGSGLA